MEELFTIASKDLVNAYNDCLKYAAVNEADARAYGFMANTSGTGAFAELAARSLVAYLQSVIDGFRTDVVLSFGFKPLSEAYVEWKSSSGYPTEFWHLTGMTGSAITARPETGGYKTTINESVAVPRIGFDGNTRGTIDALQVVKWLEEGTKYMSARPLISLASSRFLGVNYNMMKQAANTSLNRWIRENHADANDYLRKIPHGRKTTLAQVASASLSSEFSSMGIRRALNKRELPTQEKLKAKSVLFDAVRRSAMRKHEEGKILGDMRV